MTPSADPKIEVAEVRPWKPSLRLSGKAGEGGEADAVGEAGEVGLVRVSPDGKRLAYARFGEANGGIYVEDEAGVSTRIVEASDYRTEEIEWSPDGTMIAYREGESEEVASSRRVGWAKSTAPGELGSAASDAFTWRPDSKALFLYGGYSKWLAVQAIGGDCLPVGSAADMRDACDPKYPIRMAAGPLGAKVAVAVRSTVDLSHSVYVWSRKGQDPDVYETSLLTDVPGVDAMVCPFWSTKGRTAALMIAHRERKRSGIVAFRDAAGEGEILYESDQVDPPGPPAWAPSGSRIAFVREAPEGMKELVLLNGLDRKTRAVDVLLRFREPVGSPRFLRPDLLVLDGGGEALLVRLSSAP